MNEVLITLTNGTKVVDSGTGIVVCQDATTTKTYVLTCAHNVRALGRRIASDVKNPLRIVVSGNEAHLIDDEKLAKFDLAILEISAIVGVVAQIDSPKNPRSVRSIGYTHFFGDQFRRSEITGKVRNGVETRMPDGNTAHYFEIVPAKQSSIFAKGFSGAPVYASKSKKVVGVARILEQSEGNTVGYAICLTTSVRELISNNIPVIKAHQHNVERPPQPPPYKPISIRNNDLQKDRWGGKAEGFGRRLDIENVVLFRRYFEFDAVLSAVDDHPLQGPFIFHLHDTYAKSVVWLRKTQPGGMKVALEEIEASGTYTVGVQFKDYSGVWQSLEYDLDNYEGGSLIKYNR